MTYQEKVKASKSLLEAIQSLGGEEYITVEYGTDYNNNPKRYRIKCLNVTEGRSIYRISNDEVWSMLGMNVDSFTNTQMKAFTYDMMNQRTTYNFPLYEMKIVEQEGE